MAGLILVMLPLSVLIVAVVLAVAFLDAAFQEPQLQPASCSDAGGFRTLSPIRELATSIQNLGGSPSLTVVREKCASFVPRVTEPEAVVIARELRQRDVGEMHRVLNRSRQATHSCPMLTETGLCACAMTRPLACIGHCVVGGDSPEWATGLGDTVSTAFRHHLDSRHVNSQTRPLNEALVAQFDKVSS